MLCASAYPPYANYNMSQQEIQNQLKRQFPTLYQAIAEVPLSTYQAMQVPANTTIFDIGGACEQYLLLTKGSVGVKMLTKNGKSVLLYRVQPGQSCIITTSCLLGNSRYPSYGETETEIEALGIPRLAFSRALDQSAQFRKFVFDGLSQRLADVMQRLELINFTSIDSRLADALLTRAAPDGRLEATHETLAEEVGTAREVISRHLKKLETRGMLKLDRGVIQIVDSTAITKLCD